MTAIQVAFKILADSNMVPTGYTKVTKSNLIFDIKTEDFRQKTRYVASGYTLESTASLTYASVVSQEMVRIYLTMAVLNDLEVKASDIQNAYLTAPCTEKICLRWCQQWEASTCGLRSLWSQECQEYFQKPPC